MKMLRNILKEYTLKPCPYCQRPAELVTCTHPDGKEELLISCDTPGCWNNVRERMFMVDPSKDVLVETWENRTLSLSEQVMVLVAQYEAFEYFVWDDELNLQIVCRSEFQSVKRANVTVMDLVLLNECFQDCGDKTGAVLYVARKCRSRPKREFIKNHKSAVMFELCSKLRAQICCKCGLDLSEEYMEPFLEIGNDIWSCESCYKGPYIDPEVPWLFPIDIVTL